MKNRRLDIKSFNLIYVKNTTLCYFEKDKVKFTFLS